MSPGICRNETKLIFESTDEYALEELIATTVKYRSTFEGNGDTYTRVEAYGH